MRYGISWHQLVEWYQAYQNSPFGEERADLRSAIAGCAVSNEVRAIAIGLSGGRISEDKMLKEKDLMIDDRIRSARSSGSGSRSTERNEIAQAHAYHAAWVRSIEQKVEEAGKAKSTSKAKSKPRTAKPGTKAQN